ncbi:MAG: ABC transporter ATP-binding protein, partial [Anaerolineae bacterium]|nr:ABC transporter ATP-binding protein [Anaerolineae bacterium]
RAGLVRIVLLLLATYVAGWLVMSGQIYLMGLASQRTLARMRTEIFRTIQGFAMRFFDEREAGDLMSRLVNDVDVINQFLSNGLVSLVSDTLLLAGILVVMVTMHPRLALSSFAVLPLMVATTVVLSRRARAAFRRTREKIGAVSADLEENLSGMRVVQAFARESQNLQRFVALNAENRDANVQAQAITSAFMPTVDVLSTVAIAIVMGYGAYLAGLGQVTVGVIVSFLVYVQRFYQPIRRLSNLYAMAQSALAGAERIFHLLDTPEEYRERDGTVDLPPIQGRVEFRDVHFAYKPGEPVLQGINLVAEPGQTVALVGPTGAGKTTIVALLARFYDVTEGQVLVDGYDVRDVRLASLRSQMGMVPQDSFLFSGTIADNIRYGRLDATDEEVEAAARLVNAHDFIMSLPKGYQTEVTERGSNLSLGQRQLISFARAILADPRILILDEATSSVDTRTEMLIQRALERLLENRTAFIVAHRLSTIRNADQVLVVEGGRIVERGTHRELLARRGRYYELYQKQFRDKVPRRRPGEVRFHPAPAT